ncbi:MAG: nucleoid occlusion protein [Firmicutes bacterium]|nr:nucleoid occlusion protein [Bacillota bacterium]
MLELLNKKSGFWPVFSTDKQTEQEQVVQVELVEQEEDIKVSQIPMEDIFANPEQPRKIFSDEELRELSDSIKDYGVLQPILVKPKGDGTYFLIAGERRYRASKLAGLKKIPAIVREMEEEEAALVALVENVQRENLNYIEEAKAYRKLMEDFNLTQGDIAKKVGKQQSTISNKIRILSLPEEIQMSLTENKLTERHARALLKLSDESDRRQVIDRIVKNSLNVKQTEKLIDDLLRSQEEQRSKKRKVNYISYKIYVNTLRKAFMQIKEMENNVNFSQEDKGDFLEVKITIPKKVGFAD